MKKNAKANVGLYQADKVKNERKELRRAHTLLSVTNNYCIAQMSV